MRKFRDLRRRLPAGWRIAGHTGGGHLRVVKAGRPMVIVAATPSDNRAWRNAVAQIRRADRRVPGDG